MMDVRKLQATLGVAADNIPGIGTFTALFRKLGASQERAEELAICAAVYFPQYGIMDSGLRLAHFMAQLTHESGAFKYMEEIWGPTPAQQRYEGRADLGNTVAGDGFRYKGRGPIQLTGRTNYRAYGRALGMDFERHPEIVALPSIGLRAALEYWKKRNINADADRDDVAAVTKEVNGGDNGLADRKARLTALKGWML